MWFICFSCSILWHCVLFFSWTIGLEKMRLNTQIKMSNRSAKLCMFSYMHLFVVVVVRHHHFSARSYLYFQCWGFFFIDVPFVLLGSWEMIYRFVVGSRTAVSKECVGCFVCLAFKRWTVFCWRKINKKIMRKLWSQTRRRRRLKISYYENHLDGIISFSIHRKC